MGDTLYISDLDGTLLGPDGRLSQTSTALLNHALARGAMISVATARTPATVNTLMKDVDLRLPLIVMTGASLWDKATGVYSDVQYFHPSQVSKIIESYLEPAGGGGFLYTLSKREKGNDLMEIYHVGEINDVESNFMKERIHNPYKKFIVPESGRSDIPDKISNAVLFFGMRPNAVAEKIIRNLEGIGGINPMHYHDWYGDEITEVEAFPDGATKAKAIKRLKEKTGARKVVVFGDNMNDLSMMKAADWSVAVANAVQAVKEAADEVIGSNCADSVPRYILASLNKG